MHHELETNCATRYCITQFRCREAENGLDFAGKRSEIPGLEGAGRAVQVVDGIMSAAALIIVIALFKRVPLLRR